MMVRLKQKISKINNPFFIFSSKVKLLFCILGEHYLYHNLENFTRMGDFTWWVNDCDELVGVTWRLSDFEELSGSFLEVL